MVGGVMDRLAFWAKRMSKRRSQFGAAIVSLPAKIRRRLRWVEFRLNSISSLLTAQAATYNQTYQNSVFLF